MKAYLLARVSTEDQIDALPAQEFRIKSYAEGQGFEWQYFSIQKSAYSGDRKLFREIVERVSLETEKVALVFDKIDRLTRDPTSEEYIRILRMSQAGRIELHFPQTTS